MRPWRPIACGPRQGLLAVHISTDALDCRITDFCGYWRCVHGREELKVQVDEQTGGDMAVEDVLDILRNCYTEEAPADQYSFHVTTGGASATLRIELEDFVFTFECAADADPAARLRDELTLPLLHAFAELEPHSDGWPPRDATHARSLPSFNSAPSRRLLQWAAGVPADGGLALAAPVAAAVAVPGGAGGGGAPSAPDAAAVAQAAAEQRKRKVAEEREEKARKQQAKLKNR
jgi:hypothetical protein